MKKKESDEFSFFFLYKFFLKEVEESFIYGSSDISSDTAAMQCIKL